MSTQYGTLSHHKTVQVPMWLIVALVVGMLAIAVGYTVEQYQGRGAVATSTVATFPDTQVAAREGGAVLPATVDAPVFPGGLETVRCHPRHRARTATRCSPAAWRRPVSSPSTGVGDATRSRSWSTARSATSACDAQVMYNHRWAAMRPARRDRPHRFAVGPSRSVTNVTPSGVPRHRT